MQTEFDARPGEIMYMPLPDGQADVWLRKNITEGTADTEDGTQTIWTADEVYVRTELAESEVTEDFEALYAETEQEMKLASMTAAELIAELKEEISMLTKTVAEQAEALAVLGTADESTMAGDESTVAGDGTLIGGAIEVGDGAGMG